MAARTWTLGSTNNGTKGGSTGDWNTAANWSGALVPTSADTVTIGFGSNSNTFTVTEDAATATASTLKIDGDALGGNNPVTLSMVGNALTVGTTVVLNNDQSKISGFGTLSAGGAISGSGTITATGGLLDLTGAGSLSSGPVLTIGTAVGSTLEIDLAGAATSANPITINSAAQTLEVGPSGKFTINGGNESITNGTIQLAGGSLTDTGGITLNNTSAKLTGFGTVTTGTTTSTDFDGTGAVTATGGVLDFTKATNSGSVTAYHIAASAGSVLQFDGAVGTATIHPAVTFDSVATGGLGTLDLTDATNNDFHGTVNNFVIHDKIQVLNADHVTLNGAGTVLTVFDASNTQLEAITLGQSHTGFTFSVDTATDTITTDMPCYAAGTRILTATGERVVESLLQGDIALTLSGGELSAQPVKWLGRRRIDLTAHPHPETVAPIRIRRGAFADSMPHTDLLVSPDHAVFVDGKLICARQLINGTTIRQEKGWTAVDYFHVELDSHAILLAEGLPAESYLNTGNRGFFANSGEPLVLHPDLTDETDYPTRQAGSCAPFVWDEASVRPVWQRLAERAEALGQPAPHVDTTTDPGLRIVVKGRMVKPLYGENGLFIFALPKGATEVRLVSRAGAPTDTRPWLDDRRSLGVSVERVLLRGANEMREIPLDYPDLSQGWWAVERDGAALRRWTNGAAVLPLPAMDGPTMLEIRANNAGMSYLERAEQASLVA
jgi:hypothetical protein